MISELQPNEVPLLIPGAIEFAAVAKFPGGFNPVEWTTRWAGLIASKRGHVIALFPDGDSTRKNVIGGLGCILANDLQNGDLTLIEGFWFVRPEHRGRGLELLAAFHKLKDELGCKRTALIHLTNVMPEKLKRYYKSIGYVEVETHYVRA